MHNKAIKTIFALQSRPCLIDNLENYSLIMERMNYHHLANKLNSDVRIIQVWLDCIISEVLIANHCSLRASVLSLSVQSYYD